MKFLKAIEKSSIHMAFRMQDNEYWYIYLGFLPRILMKRYDKFRLVTKEYINKYNDWGPYIPE